MCEAIKSRYASYFYIPTRTSATHTQKMFFLELWSQKNNPSNLPALLMWTLPDLTYLSDPDSIIVSFCASVSQSPKNVLHKIFQNSYMDLLQLLHGFVNVVTWICHVVTSLSNPLPNKTKVVKLVACPKLHVLCFQILEGICDDEPNTGCWLS